MENSSAMLVLPLKGTVVFPNMTVNVEAVSKRAVLGIEQVMARDGRIFLTAEKCAPIKEFKIEDIYTIGTIARVKQMVRMSGESVRIVADGLERARLIDFKSEDGFCTGTVETVATAVEYDELEAQALLKLLIDEFELYQNRSGRLPKDVVKAVKNIRVPAQAADTIAAAAMEQTEKRQEILETLDPIVRMERVYAFLVKEGQMVSIQTKVQERVKLQVDKAQREYYLREQLRAIHRELGESEETVADELCDSVEKSGMPEATKQKAKKELARMDKMPQGMPEAALIRSYVECLLELPWKKKTKDNLDIQNARKILDEDHFGLEKVKDRIIEYLAVCALSGGMRGPVLCFVGPPGVGKTSIARSIARAVGRKFVRMSLGGVRDEAEIRGHRRTYVGAMPGRIVTSIKQAGTINPVFLLDEIDKMSADFRGDPASAMLEVLDPEQNSAFRDHFIDMPYDLSKVMFITTANSLEAIPLPLRDRMEIIPLSSYTDVEKKEIAQRHLLSRQIAENGLQPGDVEISDSAMLFLINNYTREAGVRSLERQLASLCRKCACEKVKGEKTPIILSEKKIEELLGAPKFHREDLFMRDMVGTANGLAWTSIGGETLTIDVTLYNGSGELLLTGQLGDVMKESARAALSIIRANCHEWSIADSVFKKKDIHIHIPEGATPKDGPSAGVTMLSAMLSAITEIPVRGDTAMTGEITLRGRVLPIGGLKEKTLAAFRAGIKRIVIPKDNLKDIEDIPQNVAEKIEFIAVENVDELLKNVLTEGKNAD